MNTPCCYFTNNVEVCCSLLDFGKNFREAGKGLLNIVTTHYTVYTYM